jgi:hypothetical protein
MAGTLTNKPLEPLEKGSGKSLSCLVCNESSYERKTT